MKIFASWSGQQSLSVAITLKKWIPKILPSVEIFVSAKDIDKGVSWFATISKELEASNFGIICLTQSNVNKSWINFEAGAIAKKLGNSHVCTLLIDIPTSDLIDPLKQFQNTLFKKDDLLELLRTINKQLGIKAITETRLKGLFKRHWPQLERAQKEALNLSPILYGKVGVVIVAKKFKRSFDIDSFVHYASIYAISKLSKLFTRFPLKDVEYIRESDIRLGESFDVEICTGSPGWNPRTTFYVEQHCKGLYFANGKTIKKDQSLIIKLKIPQKGTKQHKTVFLLYGDQSKDTMVCVDYFCNHFDELSQTYFRKDKTALRFKTLESGNHRIAEFIRDESRKLR